MRKMKNFTLDDIMRRRTLNSLDKVEKKNLKLVQTTCNVQDQQYEFNQNELLMNVFEEFRSGNINHPPIFSNETKVHLVETIAKKLNLKLNVTKITQKMKIRKIQHIEIIEKPQKITPPKKKQLTNSTLDAKKIDLSLIDSKVFSANKKFSYFVLSGHLHLYEKDLKEESKRKNSFEDQMSNEMMFYNWKQFQLEYPSFRRIKTFSQFSAYGLVFQQKLHQQQQNPQQQKQLPLIRQNTNSHKCNQLIIAQDALIVEVQNPQYEDQYMNQAGMQYQKMAKTIEGFSIFRSLGRKIRNYIQFFQLKEYQRNQEIYSIGDPVDKFYLLIKGQIVFQHSNTNPIKSPSTTPKQSRKNSIHMHLTIKTQTVSSGSYFGQQQMMFSIQQRLLTAKCKSSKCQMLQIPKEKFFKMLEYSDFYDCIKKGADIKFKQRLAKLQKNKQIRTKFALTEFNQPNSDQIHSSKRPPDLYTVPLFGTPKKSLDGRYKVMHGQVIRQFSKQQKQKMGQEVNFSMLKVNQDMYDKTLDKFRKYKIKPRQKYIPQVNWELKRVWKVLNLENVLREQAEVSSPEGRKFYDSHKRYICHIKQSKSLRPKTSSSTYRTKLQYIAYLQKFKSQK